MKTAVVGASGYAGSELLRVIASHPDLELVLATGESAAGRRISDHVPALAALYPTDVFGATAEVLSSDADVVFLALPHGASQALVPDLLAKGKQVVDLGADYRLSSADDYETWYGHPHSNPDLMNSAVYALVERHRSDLVGANFLAVPGCYPTATSLALGPFFDRGKVSGPVVVNALSGVSGAGRSPSDRLHFPRLAANAEAYGLTSHRHTIEIQSELGVEVLFTPHLVPVSRGMLVTAYARVSEGLSTDQALELLRTTYANDPCVVVTNEPPSLKDPLGSNLCFVSARVDERTGWLVAMSSIDNLVKGAAGQALQAWNVANRRPETLGLPMVGVTP